MKENFFVDGCGREGVDFERFFGGWDCFGFVFFLVD